MSRPLRIQYPNAWYHVMNRGRRGEAVFQSKDDYQRFIDILGEAIELFSLRISAYWKREKGSKRGQVCS